MHPQAMALATQAIAAAGGNIHSFSRTSDNPVTIAITISGLSKEALEAALLPLKFEDATNISVSDL
jgi:hypothetical protein